MNARKEADIQYKRRANNLCTYSTLEKGECTFSLLKCGLCNTFPFWRIQSGKGEKRKISNGDKLKNTTWASWFKLAVIILNFSIWIKWNPVCLKMPRYRTNDIFKLIVLLFHTYRNSGITKLIHVEIWEMKHFSKGIMFIPMVNTDYFDLVFF